MRKLLYVCILALAVAYKRLNRERLDLDEDHTVVFSIKQSDEGIRNLRLFIHEKFETNSRSDKPFLTRKQVVELTDHSDRSLTVKEYLSRNGITNVESTNYGEYIYATAKISIWESLLSTQFHLFEISDGVFIVRSLEYFVPEDIKDHVIAIFNTNQIPAANRNIINKRIAPKKKEKYTKPSLRALAVEYITPAYLNMYYNITNNTCDPRATQSAYAALGQYFSPSDIAGFLDAMDGNYNYTVRSEDGHSSDAMCQILPDQCSEANMDLEYMISLCQGPSTSMYYDYNDDFLLWVFHAANEEHPPLVQSISYGSDESDVPQDYIDAFELEILKLVAQGVTVLVASGDDGVHSPYARGNMTMCGYNPSFPATSQYVTAVGGTAGPEDDKSEHACQSDLGEVITSGGGFSAKIPAPSWQRDAVNGYFSRIHADSVLTPVLGYGSGRGIPDVSLLAHHYMVDVAGYGYMLSGTSASTPVFAAMVSLVNTARFAKGKEPIGWLNPQLYKLAHLFANDITGGRNFCTAQASEDVSSTCCSQGFYGTAGWDPVTGIGSIDFKKFLHVLTQM